MNKRLFLNVGPVLGLAGLSLLTLLAVTRAAPPAPPANVAPQVWEATAKGGETEFLVVLAEQADLDAATTRSTREERLHYVHDTLREVALRSQSPLRAELDRAGVDYCSFYVVNVLVVKGNRALVARLAARPDVARIAANPRVRQTLPEPRLDGLRPLVPQAVEWGVRNVNADDVWALGYTGQGVVVAGQDTGYDWDHPALVNQYRGYNGVTATHDYNWHDAIHTNDPHTPAGNPCGFDFPEPCDDHGHGTHTMGTIVGDDGEGNQVGVAPGARWIGCRNMEEGWGTPATYIECFEFFIAPYPVGGDPVSDSVPSMAPHVINNSWTCPSSEGCAWDTLQMTVENVRAAGIVVVASAGNSGYQGCSTVGDPPALYDAAFSVGATNSGDDIAGFSSRGPVTRDGSGRLKPDVSAPGVSVRSSRRDGGYVSMSGTSMAGPHVAGTMALLWSAAPVLIGDVEATEQIIAQTARPRTTTQGCGGDGPDDVPNNVYGWGIVDALAAVQTDIPGLTVTKQAHPDPVQPGAQLTYTLRVANTGNVTLTATLTDVLPAHVTPTGIITWTPTVTAPGGVWMETVVVTVEMGYEGPLTNVVQVTTDEGATGVYTVTTSALAPHLEVSKRAYPNPVQAGAQLTYTLRVTNTGGLTLTATITDILPGHVTPTGVITWTPVIIAPGGVWAETVVVTVEMGYEGPLTNVVQVTTDEGATGAYTVTTPALAPRLEVSKQATFSEGVLVHLLKYALVVTNTSSYTVTQVVLTDAIPVSTTFAWASGNYTQAGGVVTWTAASLAPNGVLTATLAVTVEHLPPGTSVVNAAYGVRAGEHSVTVMGAPVEAVIPWRCLLFPVFKNWSLGGNGGG